MRKKIILKMSRCFGHQMTFIIWTKLLKHSLKYYVLLFAEEIQTGLE